MIYNPALPIPYADGLTGLRTPNIEYLMFLVRVARTIGMILELD